MEKIKNLNKYKIFNFVIMTFLLIAVKMEFISSICLLILISFNLFNLYKKKINEIEFILLSMIMPSEFYSLVALGVVLIILLIKIIRKKEKLKNFKNMYLLLLFLTLSAIISSIINKTVLSALMTITYLFIMFFIYKISESMEYSLEKFINIMNKILLIQFVAIMVQFINYKQFIPSDAYSGTFSNAHKLCVWLILNLVLIFIYLKENNMFKSKNSILKVIIVVIMIYLTDGKHILLGTFLAIILWGICLVNKKMYQNKVLSSGIIIIIAMYVGVNLVGNIQFKNFLSDKVPYVHRYVYEYPYNNKFNYFSKTLDNYKVILGYGPGQYGSRIANIRAHEYMEKEDQLAITASKIIKPYINEDYKEFASEYNKEYLEKVKDMSAVLSYPFSSLISLIAEFGILGYILFLCFFNSIAKKERIELISLIPIIFLCLMIFDSYFEMTNVVVLFWIIIGVLKSDKNKRGLFLNE